MMGVRDDLFNVTGPMRAPIFDPDIDGATVWDPGSWVVVGQPLPDGRQPAREPCPLGGQCLLDCQIECAREARRG